MMLQGKRVLVTGSSSGIGFGAAKAMWKQGATIAMTSELDLDKCPDVKNLCVSPTVRYFKANLLTDGEASRLVDEVTSEIGTLDVLVNNLGTFREPSFLELTRRDFDFVFHLNVWSAIAMSQAFAKKLIAENRPGRIIFTTSLNGTRSEPAHTLYDASKGAINALNRQLAIELAPYGITTVAIAPGLVETPLTDMGLKSDPVARQSIIDQIPIRKIATVEDLAQWFVFLASDAASYSTGTIVTVDGGLDAQQMPSRPITEAEASLTGSREML